VQSALEIKFVYIQAFTDSTVVLACSKSDANRWKTCVKNRVSKIQSPSIWYHVPGEADPAHFASRGLYADGLLQHVLGGMVINMEVLIYHQWRQRRRT